LEAPGLGLFAVLAVDVSVSSTCLPVVTASHPGRLGGWATNANGKRRGTVPVSGCSGFRKNWVATVAWELSPAAPKACGSALMIGI